MKMLLSICNLLAIFALQSQILDVKLQIAVSTVTHEIKIFDDNLTLIQTLYGHTAVINKLFNLNDGTIISGSNDFTIRRWDAETGALLTNFTFNKSITSFELINDKTVAFGYGDDSIRFMNISNGNVSKELKGHNGAVKCLKLIKIDLLASGSADGRIIFWNLTTNSIEFKFSHASEVNDMVLLDNQTLISCSDDETIKIWSLSNYTLTKTLNGHTNKTTSLILIGNTTLASGSHDKTIKLWNLKTYGLLGSMGNTYVSSLEYLDENKDLLYSGGSGGLLKIWNLTTRTAVKIAKIAPITHMIKLKRLNYSLANSGNLNINYDYDGLNEEILNFLGDINLEELIRLLKNNSDLSGCLVNCSNRGTCEYNKNTTLLNCKCEASFKGSSCSILKNACLSNPCMNNGTCNNLANGFECICEKNFYGKNCENKLNLCKGFNCSGNGNCFDVDNKPVCKCFNLYEGENCELQTYALKLIKAGIKTSTIIAIIVICLSYITICALDLSKSRMKHEIKNRKSNGFKQRIMERINKNYLEEFQGLKQRNQLNQDSLKKFNKLK